MEGLKVIHSPEVKWGPHQQLPGVEIAYLLSRHADAVGITCALVNLQAGTASNKHSHEHSDDILYVLRGKLRCGSKDLVMFHSPKVLFYESPKGYCISRTTLRRTLSRMISGIQASCDLTNPSINSLKRRPQ